MNRYARFIRRLGAVLFLGFLLSSGSTVVADPGTLWVNDDDPNGSGYAAPGTSCNDPGYETIQAAVDDAVSGDRINVCPGTYIEQVTIPAGTDNIRLRSVRRWEAVIKAPMVMLDPKAIVRVNGAQDVTILAFTITGPGGGPCNSLQYGVRVDNGGSADILGNHITHIRDEPFSGCQNGVAVLVGRQLEGTTGSARIIGNVFDNYQKNGPTVDNTGSHAEIIHNRILGIGPTDVIAQNGFQVSRGATGQVRHNLVANHIYTPQTFASTGGILFFSGEVLTDHNTLTSNDVSVFMIATAGSTVTHNRVRASTFDGVALLGEAASQVAHNKSDQNDGPGIGMYDSQENLVEKNHVQDNNGSGIVLDNADTNLVDNNKVRDNGTPDGDTTDGIRVSMTSTSNTLQNNHLKDNVTHDCHDDSAGTGISGTANSWVNNHGQTSSPPGLCSGEDAEEASFETSTVFGWDPDYPWYDGFDLADEYDWAAAYATIDVESLLESLPLIGTGHTRGLTLTPYQ